MKNPTPLRRSTPAGSNGRLMTMIRKTLCLELREKSGARRERVTPLAQMLFSAGNHQRHLATDNAVEAPNLMPPRLRQIRRLSAVSASVIAPTAMQAVR